MAASPPRPASPASHPRPPKPPHNLQISPNLEALLQHDELTRRNSSSPTSSYYTSPSSEFPISLPPPPPRKANGGRKAGQEIIPMTRGQRQKSAVVGSDLALPKSFPADAASVTNQSPSGTSSRPMTPNPYLNPTPVLERINAPELDDVPTPKPAEKSLPNEPKSDSSRSAAETRGRVAASDPSQCHRPSTALHKVEKILWMGRDSLNLFSGSANGVKRDSDRRHDHHDPGELDAVQDKQMRQVSRPASRLGDRDTATVTSSAKSASPCLDASQRGSHDEPSETIPESDLHSDTASPPSLPPTHLPPRLSLPSIFMSNSSSQRPQTADSVTPNDYLSFIDFFSPSTLDDSALYTDAEETSPARRRLPSISIPPRSIYSMSQHNLSSTTLASMRFAPPSPTSLTVQQASPPYAASTNDSSPDILSAMVFAPPSPSTERIPLRLQPLSDPPSPYSPLEFAPPPSPPHGAIDGSSLPTGLVLAPERGRKLKGKKRSKSTSPYHGPVSPLPPTTNELGANERADRIRRNRKLARVFGMTPGVEEPVTDVDEPRVSKRLHPPTLAALLPKQKNHRHAVSVSVSVKTSGMKTEPSTPWRTQELWASDGRRHSTPLSTNFTLYVDDETPTKSIRRSRTLVDSPEDSSARSFIDLSDEDVRDDDVSELGRLIPPQRGHQHLHHSTSTPSLVESLDSEAQAELDRRRKREQLAKLHRFLGSRVPPEALNGGVLGPPLPPEAPASLEDSFREHWLRGRKNALEDDFDRGREMLDERERALNVRRAQKMERVFGTTPPQILFHTRTTRPTAPLSQPASPANTNPFVLTLDLPSSPRNLNQSAYMGKTLHRRGPSDSSQCLLPRNEDTPQSSPSSFAQSFADSLADSLSGYQQVLAQSSVYLNYQHSLNSLVDIIDRDDRQSLLQLHHFLHGDDAFASEEVVVNPRRVSIAASLSSRSERRHSLPSNASMTSLSSEFYASPRASLFQFRRRKAAKLTNFFGVDYRDLIHDILESIEKGVEEERNRGTLQPREAEVLIHRVRSLRSMKDPFLSS